MAEPRQPKKTSIDHSSFILLNLAIFRAFVRKCLTRQDAIFTMESWKGTAYMFATKEVALKQLPWWWPKTSSWCFGLNLERKAGSWESMYIRFFCFMGQVSLSEPACRVPPAFCTASLQGVNHVYITYIYNILDRAKHIITAHFGFDSSIAKPGKTVSERRGICEASVRCKLETLGCSCQHSHLLLGRLPSYRWDLARSPGLTPSSSLPSSRHGRKDYGQDVWVLGC